MYKASFNYELKMPVKVASKGMEIDAVSIEIFAPTNQVMTDVGVLDFEFNRAKKGAIKESTEMIKGLSKETLDNLKVKEVEVKEEEATPQQITREMSMYGSDMNRCFLALKNILTAGNKERPVCLIDCEKMTSPIFDSLGFEDTKLILGKYIISFLDISRGI